MLQEEGENGQSNPPAGEACRQKTPEKFQYRVALEDLVERQPLNLSVGGSNNHVHFAVNVALLPPSEDMSRYEEVFPGATEYIMKAADGERSHRHSLERLLVQGGERRKALGLGMSFALSLTGLFGAIGVGVWGSPWVATILAVVAVGGPLAAQTLALTLAPRDDAPRSGLASALSASRPTVETPAHTTS